MEVRRTDRRQASIHLAWLLLTLPLLGCGADLPVGEAAVTRDSAGVRIVEARLPVWEQTVGWRLSAEPILDIGVQEGAPEYQLFRVYGATRLVDGRIAVVNSGTNEIRIYDDEGRFLASLGGTGDGPGEFRRLVSAVALAGDSILAFDPAANRITVFSPAGGVAGSTRLDRTEESGRITTVARLSDGGLLATTAGSVNPQSMQLSPLHRPPTPILRLSSSGDLIDTVGTFEGDELATWDEGGVAIGPPPYGRKLAHAVAGDRLYIGTQESFEIRVFGLDGGLEAIIRAPDGDLELTAALKTDYRARILARIPDAPPEAIRELDQYLAVVPLPDRRPAYGPILVDSEGNLWVGEYDPLDASSTRFAIFGPDGYPLGAIDLPAALQLFEIGSDYLLGLWKDDLEVEHIRLYRLER